MRKLGKIQLKREVIAKLQDGEMSDMKGGTGCTTSATCGHEVSIASCLCTTSKITEYVDIPTFSHDDGSWCASNSNWACGNWCYGQ